MSILLFLAVLFVLVLVHEFGHFIAARKSGMRVDEFGIGFPPRLFSRRHGETLYTLNAIPLGGFVKIFGEDRDEAASDPESKRAFSNRPLKSQALVLVAGVTANILLAYVLFATAFMIGTDMTVEESEAGPDTRLAVLSVMPGSPAAMAGVEPGDQIYEVRTESARIIELLPSAVSETIGSEGRVIMTFDNDGERVTRELVAQPRIIDEEDERKVVGITMGLLKTTSLPPHIALWRAGTQTISGLWAITAGIGGLLFDAALFQADLTGVAGPVGIAGLVGDAAQFGIAALLSFTAFISLNLAVINLLPFPALDGGRLLFVVLEAFRGKPVPQRMAYAANALGFVLLMLLMLAVTYNDIARLIS